MSSASNAVSILLFSQTMSDEKSSPSSLSAADHVGQAAGGISGVLAGAAIGTTAGPLGTLLGGIAGAIGGWWSGRALAEAAEGITEADDTFYRDHFERSQDARRRYDEARAAYYLGDVAAANPEYRSFEDVEAELSRAHGEWEAVRGYASVGFQRGRERRKKPR